MSVLSKQRADSSSSTKRADLTFPVSHGCGHYGKKVNLEHGRHRAGRALLRADGCVRLDLRDARVDGYAEQE